MAQARKPLAVLRDFFGPRPGEGLKEFAAEVKHLSPDERVELARLAADEMGVTLAAD